MYKQQSLADFSAHCIVDQNQHFQANMYTTLKYFNPLPQRDAF